MNFAAVKELPLVIVIENNHIAVSTSIKDTARIENLSSVPPATGFPARPWTGSIRLRCSER